MTELERQLTAALEKLSAQFETEQKRHYGQVESLQHLVERLAAENGILRQQVEQQVAQSDTLRQRVEQLSGHVTGLDADYRTLAGTLRELLN